MRDNIMRKILIIVLCLFYYINSEASSDNVKLQVDTNGAKAMLNVLKAIHDKKDYDEIESLLNEVLALPEYEICKARYKESKPPITLSQYRNFILSISKGKPVTKNNIRLKNALPFYLTAIENLNKFYTALEQFNAIPDSLYQKAIDRASEWSIKNDTHKKFNFYLLIDWSCGVYLYSNKQSENIVFGLLRIYDKSLHFFDKDGKLNSKRVIYTLAHELNHAFGTVPEKFSNLPRDSKEKMFFDFIWPAIYEGIAIKCCQNGETLISTKIYPDEYSDVTGENPTWNHFLKKSQSIFKHANKFLLEIINGKFESYKEYDNQFMKYWWWSSGEYSKGKQFDKPRYYYLGAEMIGIIYQAFGKNMVLEIRKKPLMFIPIFNKALKKLKPENYRKYLFDEKIVNTLEKWNNNM